MKATTTGQSLQRRLGYIAALGLGALLAGCSGNPPTEQFALTESAIKSAVSADATQYAPVEMRDAQDKWRQADLAMHSENYDTARMLAQQAEWDARVAERKANAMKVQKAVADAQKGIEDLRQESLRQAQ